MKNKRRRKNGWKEKMVKKRELTSKGKQQSNDCDETDCKQQKESNSIKSFIVISNSQTVNGNGNLNGDKRRTQKEKQSC